MVFGIEKLKSEQEVESSKIVVSGGYSGREKEKRIWYGTNIVPGYCLSCQKQMDGFFGYYGGRYGQVGPLECEVCGSVMGVTDNDAGGHDEIYISLNRYRNPFLKDVEDFGTKIPMLHVDLGDLYGLTVENFDLVFDRTGFDIYQRKNDVNLNLIISEVCEKARINEQEIPTQQLTTDEKFPLLPPLVVKWLNLLLLIASQSESLF